MSSDHALDTYIPKLDTFIGQVDVQYLVEVVQDIIERGDPSVAKNTNYFSSLNEIDSDLLALGSLLVTAATVLGVIEVTEQHNKEIYEDLLGIAVQALRDGKEKLTLSELRTLANTSDPEVAKALDLYRTWKAYNIVFHRWYGAVTEHLQALKKRAESLRKQWDFGNGKR